jgi:hypothetical protein
MICICAIVVVKLPNNKFQIGQAKKALELDPSDQTPPFLLGLWSYEVASIGWMTRKLAATFFAEPPTATYEQVRLCASVCLCVLLLTIY